MSLLPRAWPRRAAISFGLALTLGGCAVGPNFHRPPAPSTQAYTARPLPRQTSFAPVPGGAVQRIVVGGAIPGEWWRLFHSQSLDAVIRQALKASPDLHAARAALRQASERTAAARSALFPAAATDFSAGPNRTAQSLGAVPANGKLYYTLYTPELAVAYSPDVFGGTRRQIESLAAREQVRRFALEAAYLSLTSDIVAVAIDEARLHAQIAATHDVIRIVRAQLRILRRELALGQVAGADVAAQETRLAETQARLPPLEKALARDGDRLTTLAGRFPSQPVARRFTLSSFTLPAKLPLSLPAQLVAQRPDVRAAAARLHSASALVGVAIANRLPQVTLTGSLGSSALTLGGLGLAGNLFWSVAGDVSQTLFDAGALRHEQRAAQAALAYSGALYQRTVLRACRNVADVLHALFLDAAELSAADRAEQAAQRSLDIARKQQDLGQINYVGLLSAEAAYQHARLALATAEANRFLDSAALFEALGGGWWNRGPQTGAGTVTAGRPAAAKGRTHSSGPHE